MNGLSLGALKRAAMATTSIATHEARLNMSPVYDDPRMHMTIDELRALQAKDPLTYGDGTDQETGLLVSSPTNSGAQLAKRARRAARMGTVPVVINRRPPEPVKPKRKSRAKAKTATA